MENNNKTSVISIGYGQHLFEEGNPERLRMEACASATDAYHMVVFVKNDTDLKKTFGKSGLVIHPVKSNFPILKLWKAFILVKSLINKLEGKVVVTSQDAFETGLVGWLATMFTEASLNVQEHGDVFSTTYWRDEKVLNIFRFYLGLFILKRADSVRVVSKRITNTLIEKGIPNSKITQLSVMTSPGEFLNAEQISEIRNMFSSNCFIFLTVARFVPQKNLPLLLKSFYEAQKLASNMRLLLVGTGPELENIKQLIKESEILSREDLVKILPWTDNVPGFMKSVDSYVLSSNYEGWARVLIEAKYANLPIVTTDVGCAGEEVIDGAHGLVVPVDDEKLTEALISMTQDKIKYLEYKKTMQGESLPVEMTYETYAKEWVSTLQ